MKWSQWRAQPQASYIPDKAQRELRELVGYRKSLVADRTRELNRLQKMLEGANIKLSGTVAEINGMSARIILNELLDGKTIDKTRLEEMKKQKIIAHNLRASFDQIADDLNGVMSPLQNKMMRELLKHIDELNVHIKNLDEDIDNHMNDEEKKVQLLIDEDVMKCEYFGCHPCINTSSLKIKMEDLKNKIIPALGHEPIYVKL